MNTPVISPIYPNLLPAASAPFRAFMDNSPTVAWIKNMRGQYVYINRQFEQLWGVTLGDLWGMTDADRMPAEIACQVIASDQAVLSSGTSLEFVEMVPTPDGEPRYWQVVKFPFHDAESGLLVGGVAIDITARKQAKAALQQAIEQQAEIIALQQEVACHKHDLQATMQTIVEHAQALTRADGGVIEMLEGDEMVYRAVSGTVASSLGMRLVAATSLSGRCVKENAVLKCDDAETDDRVDKAACHKIGLRSMVLVPLRHEEQPIGVLKVLSSQANAFTEQHVSALELVGGVLSSALYDASAMEALRESKERLKEAKHFAESIADASTSHLYVLDLDTKTPLYQNRDIGAFLGYTAEQMRALGDNFMPYIIHPDDLDWMYSHLLEFASMTDAQTMEFECRIKHVDGTYHWVWLRERVFRRRSDGTPCQIMGTGNDITERKRMEAALLQSEARFRTALYSLHDGLVVQNYQGEIGIVNRRACEILGLTEDQLTGRTSIDPRWQAIHEDGTPWPGETHPAMIALRDGKEQHEIIMGVHKPTGELTWVSINAIPLFLDNETQPHVVVTFTDITERKWFEEQIQQQIAYVNEANIQLQLQQQELAQANMRLEALATTDGLTGLKNHRAFQEFLDAEFQRNTRYNHPLSVILLDVDKFKQYNDTFGHPAGDEVLKAVAQVLLQEARVCDLAARYGGEEFVIILPDTDSAGAIIMAERMRQTIEALTGLHRPVTASFGVATLQPSTERAATLIEQADHALYEAKHQGRNRVCYFGEIAGIKATI